MGHVGRAAACLDSTQKTNEEWHENRCDKHGWTSTQTFVLKGGKSITSCRINCISFLSLCSTSLSQEKLETYIFSILKNNSVH